PFERRHASPDAALRTKVGDWPATVLFAQHLFAVVNDSVDELARCVVIDARVAFVFHAQLAVKVTGDEFVAVHHLEHDAAKEVEVAGEENYDDGDAGFHP